MIELTSSGKSRTLPSLGADAKDHDLWTWTLDDHREPETFTKDQRERSGERRDGRRACGARSPSCVIHGDASNTRLLLQQRRTE